MKRGIFIVLFCASCSQAGIIAADDVATTDVSENASQVLVGRVGIGRPLVSANVSIVDVTDLENPEILSSTETDENGAFQFSLSGLEYDSEVLFVATGGTYVDPLTFQNVTNRNLALEGIWKYQHLAILQNFEITPLSTLSTAFYRCLSTNSSLAADPLDYSLATFRSLFSVNFNSDHDAFLSGADEEEISLYSLYNLAFARMAKEKRASSAADVIAAYVQELEEECDLLGPTGRYSGSYSFHRESFRSDYLNALRNLRLESSFTSQVESLDIDTIVEEIRGASNILFQFEEYTL